MPASPARQSRPSTQRTPLLELATFTTELGWMALVTEGNTVRQLVLGYPSAVAAVLALDPALVERADTGKRAAKLIKRLQSFAAGKRVDLSNVAIDTSHLGIFQRRVIAHCRQIAYGQTRSYGELATLAGSPRAARAVGTTMATNRFALIVPCHRVINADGSCGQYGGPGGKPLKQRLLALEQPRGESRRANKPRCRSAGRKTVRIRREN